MELKPCPFCGSKGVAMTYSTEREGLSLYTAAYVRCCSCGCRTNSYIDYGEYAATKAWNRRTDDAVD